MVEPQPSKLMPRVRFLSSAPVVQGVMSSASTFFADIRLLLALLLMEDEQEDDLQKEDEEDEEDEKLLLLAAILMKRTVLPINRIGNLHRNRDYFVTLLQDPLRLPDRMFRQTFRMTREN